MAYSLDNLLSSYRTAAVTEREKGTYFERLCAAYLTHDPVQAEQYEQVWHWADWAAENGWNGKDIGIDLVAKLRGHDGFAAVQCKFYDAQHKIAKADIDSFLAASAKAPFVRRIVMDSSEVEWSENAELMLVGQSIPVLRIGLVDMRASSIQWGLFAAKHEIVLEPKKELRPHQSDALDAVRAGVICPPPREDHHGLRHGQDLHRAQDRGRPRRGGGHGAVPGPVPRAHGADGS